MFVIRRHHYAFPSKRPGFSSETALVAQIVVAVALLAGFTIALAFPLRLKAQLDASAMHPDGINAFTVNPVVTTYWPYVVPAHPEAMLAPDDVILFENGKSLGPLDISHDEIRQLGHGRFDFWQGVLWFSASDNTNPQENGRMYTVRFKAKFDPNVQVGVMALLSLLFTCILTNLFEFFGIQGRSILSKGFFIINGAVLSIFTRLAWERPMPFVYTNDSWGYINAGLLMAFGQPSQGGSVRDVGYPILTLLAVKIGSLNEIPPLQLCMVVIGAFLMLMVLRLYFTQVLAYYGNKNLRIDLSIALIATMTGTIYCLLLFSHDAFILNIYSLMAEAPHFFVTALAFLCFVYGWVSVGKPRSLVWLLLATTLAYLSAMVKPHTLLVFVLCLISLLAIGLRYPRWLRSPLVLVALALCLGTVTVAYYMDVWLTPKGFDFGPKTLFCNHLDIIVRSLHIVSPERIDVMRHIQEVLAEGPNGWPLMGFDGDRCYYNQAFSDAISAAAKAEGLSNATWQQAEFIKAVLSNPLLYGGDVLRQIIGFASEPVVMINTTVNGTISDWDWLRLKPFMEIMHLSRQQFDVVQASWFPSVFPKLAQLGKSLLQSISHCFSPIIMLSVTIAGVKFLVSKRNSNLKIETVILSAFFFIFSYVLTISMSHSFDIPRYRVGLLPFTLILWIIGINYIAQTVMIDGVRFIMKLYNALRRSVHTLSFYLIHW